MNPDKNFTDTLNRRMIIKTKLTEKDYINVNFVLLYSKTIIQILTGGMIFYAVVTLLQAAFLSIGSYSTLIGPACILLILPLITYFSAKKNYSSNLRMTETIEYQFNEDNLVVKGESFNSQLSWDKIYKVTQTRNWILIWQNRQIANPIPKRDIWEGQNEELKIILDRNKIRNNLKL